VTAVLERTAPLAAETPQDPPVTRRPLGDGVTVTLLAVLVGLTHGRSLMGGPAFGDDEGTYTAQAWAVVHRSSLAHYTYWYDHPPLGWLLMALWDTTVGRLLHPTTAVEGGRQFMTVIAVVSSLLLWMLSRRLGLGRIAAVLVVLTWALCPLALSYSRMVYLDNIGVTLLLGAMVCACSPRSHLWVIGASGLLLALALLTKETLLLSAPAVVHLAWARNPGKTRPFCLAAMLGTAFLVTMLYPLLALLKGELLPGRGHVSLLEALQFQVLTRPSTGSPLSSGSASAALVGRWLDTDPWLLVGGLVAGVVALCVWHLRSVGLAVVVPVVLALRPGYLPDPFLVAVLPFAALAVVGVAESALRRVPGRRGVAVALATATTAAAVTGPSWLAGDRALADQTANRTVVAAEQWVTAHVPHTARVLVDDSLWVDLVNHGFDPHLGVIWFFKTDFTNNLDPSVKRALPHGWRDFDVVVETRIMRDALAQSPAAFHDLRLALVNSTVVATLGSGRSRIVIHAVHSPVRTPVPTP